MGMLNSVGLQNPGIDHFIEKELPYLAGKGTRIIANVAGSTVEDCVVMAEKLEGTAVDMIELNISCPNVRQGRSRLRYQLRGGPPASPKPCGRPRRSR